MSSTRASRDDDIGGVCVAWKGYVVQENGFPEGDARVRGEVKEDFSVDGSEEMRVRKEKTEAPITLLELRARGVRE